MVKFRSLLSKPKAPKKEPVDSGRTDPIERDEFSFTNIANKKEEKPQKKIGIPLSELPESKRTKPLAKSSSIKFKDIYPEQPDELQDGTQTIEDGIAAHSELDSIPESTATERVDYTAPQPVDDSQKQKSYAITQTSPQMEKSRHLLYEKAAKYLQEVLEAVRIRRKFSLSPGFKIMHHMVETQPPYDPLFANAIHSDNQGEYIVYHSVNVSIFSIKMAHYLGFDKQSQKEIGLAGLLHDLGVALIPEKILFKDGKLSGKEISVLRERPINSFKILKFVGEQHPYLADSAGQVYERIDGSGYPNGLQAEEINEYAQIIGLVSVYEALIHSRPQRAKFLHFTAVKEIMKRDKRGFQKKYLKALLNIFSIFPLSSYVKLNSNAVGRVIETYPDYPMRPKLEIIYDSQNQRVRTERILDLSKNPLLYIVDSISEDEIGIKRPKVKG